MPCYGGPDSSYYQEIRKVHHRVIELLVEDTFRTRDLDTLERLYREECAAFEEAMRTAGFGESTAAAYLDARKGGAA